MFCPRSCPRTRLNFRATLFLQSCRPRRWRPRRRPVSGSKDCASSSIRYLQDYGLVNSELGPLVGKSQTKDERIGMERIQCDRQAGQRIGGNHDRLLWTELILKRCLDVGVNEKLHRRGDAVPGRAKRPVEWGIGEAGAVVIPDQSVDPIGR